MKHLNSGYVKVMLAFCAVFPILIVVRMLGHINFDSGPTMVVVCAIISVVIVVVVGKKTAVYTMNIGYIFIVPVVLCGLAILQFVLLFVGVTPGGPAQMTALGVILYCIWTAVFTLAGELVMCLVGIVICLARGKKWMF